MNFKPFAFHHIEPKRRFHNAVRKSFPRGFTVWISPGDDPRTVKVQHTFCAYKDDFAKKLGRQFAQNAPVEVVNARKLPDFLANLSNKCGQQKCGNMDFHPEEYFFILKHLI